MVDRLPTRQELRFRRERKDLHQRLVAVIRGLAEKLENPQDVEAMLRFIDCLQPTTARDIGVLPYISPKGRWSPLEHRVSCIFSEVSHVVLAFWKFVCEESGYRRHTKTVREGIERLEWLRDNWEYLTVMGDLANGYELGEK